MSEIRIRIFVEQIWINLYGSLGKSLAIERACVTVVRLGIKIILHYGEGEIL
jgi:hypothetical protein